MLYTLTFSTYILGLVVVPYQTRVLGTEKYGLIGLASAILAYVQLIIDFGFLLSATEEVANNQTNKSKLSEIFTSVTINGLFLSILSSAALLAACLAIPRWKENFLFIFLYLISTVLGSMMPNYLYRGIEKMEAITIRTVIIKVFFTAMVFIFVKGPEDILLIPVFQIIGNLLALLVTYQHLFAVLGVRFVRCKASDVILRLKKSCPFFVSRIATTVYSASNTILLDLISGGAMTAFYTSADKLVSTAKSGLSPISDSMYPYMVRNKDFKLVKKILLILEPIIIIGCAVVFIWATPLCTWFFGEEYAQTAPALRALLPIVAIILPSYIFGFPVLGAMGLNKYANYSIIVASILHISTLTVLFCLGLMNMVTLCISTSVTEFVVLIYRLTVVIKNRHLLNPDNQESKI